MNKLKWEKDRTVILEHYLWAVVYWGLSWERRVTHRDLANELGVSQSSVQSRLTGKAIWFGYNHGQGFRHAFNVLNGEEMYLTRVDIAQRVEVLREELAAFHQNLEIITSFPADPPKLNERILRAFQIEDWLMEGEHRKQETGRNEFTQLEKEEMWRTVLHPTNIEPDDIWRARVREKWSRRRAAEAFGVCEGTIYHWERINFPQRHWMNARVIYRSLK